MYTCFFFLYIILIMTFYRLLKIISSDYVSKFNRCQRVWRMKECVKRQKLGHDFLGQKTTTVGKSRASIMLHILRSNHVFISSLPCSLWVAVGGAWQSLQLEKRLLLRVGSLVRYTRWQHNTHRIYLCRHCDVSEHVSVLSSRALIIRVHAHP